MYSRGLGPYFLTGTNHQAVVKGRAPRHRGVLMGRVCAACWIAAVIVEPAEAHALAPLKPGDGVVFDAADWRSPEEPEEGGRIYQAIARRDGAVELRFANGAIHFAPHPPGRSGVAHARSGYRQSRAPVYGGDRAASASSRCACG